MEYYTSSEQETKELAKNLARKINRGIIALSGDLGAGKTTFAQGFAKGLGIKNRIISPTFILIRQHQIPKSKKNLYHIDLYRLGKNTDIKELGIEDLFTIENIVLIEWADKIKNLLPKNTVYINIEKLGGDLRKIIIEQSLF